MSPLKSLFLLSVLLLSTIPSSHQMGADLFDETLERIHTGIFPGSYGVDCSFPIHHMDVVKNYDWLPEADSKPNGDSPAITSVGKQLGKIKSYVTSSNNQYDPSSPANPLSWKQKTQYEENMAGCGERYSKGSCLSTERDRVAMNLRQPASMTNYTELGFAKVMMPEDLFGEIKDFWKKYKDSGRKDEEWPTGNTYTNHWSKPTMMVNLENRKLRGGMDLKNKIWAGSRDILEKWVDQELTATSLYGIRIYQDGHVLAPHVDRMPLVVSCIINVDQDLDEPWPLEVYAHNGLSYNVTMEPGEMILYESHSVIHGRPFALSGRFMANIFVHYEPHGHTLRHQEKTRIAKEEIEAAKRGGKTPKELDEEYAERALNQQGGGHEHFQVVEGDDTNDDFAAKEALAEEMEEEDNDDLDAYRPVYILKGSEEDNRWRSTYLRTHKVKSPDNYDNAVTGSNFPIHKAAQKGDFLLVQREVNRAKDKKAAVSSGDANGWEPLHEAARGGHLEIAKFLVDSGADINKRVNFGEGPSAARLAKEAHGNDHPIVAWFREMKALDLGPEL